MKSAVMEVPYEFPAVKMHLILRPTLKSVTWNSVVFLPQVASHSYSYGYLN